MAGMRAPHRRLVERPHAFGAQCRGRLVGSPSILASLTFINKNFPSWHSSLCGGWGLVAELGLELVGLGPSMPRGTQRDTREARPEGQVQGEPESMGQGQGPSGAGNSARG